MCVCVCVCECVCVYVFVFVCVVEGYRVVVSVFLYGDVFVYVMGVDRERGGKKKKREGRGGRGSWCLFASIFFPALFLSLSVYVCVCLTLCVCLPLSLSCTGNGSSRRGVEPPADLAAKWSFMRWEHEGRPLRSPAEDQAAYDKTVADLKKLMKNGMSGKKLFFFFL